MLHQISRGFPPGHRSRHFLDSAREHDHDDANLYRDADDAKCVILQVFPILPVPGPTRPKQIWRVAIIGGSPEYLFTVPTGSGFSCARFPFDLCAVAEPTEDRKQFIISVLDTNAGKRGRQLFRYDRYPNSKQDPGPIGIKDLNLGPMGWMPDGKALLLTNFATDGTVVPACGPTRPYKVAMEL